MRSFLFSRIRQMPHPLFRQRFPLKPYAISSQRIIVTGLKAHPLSRMSTQANALTILIEAVQKQDSNIIKRMAEEQPQLIAEQTSNDNTALHEAARLGDVEMIDILAKTFSKNFNVNHKCHCYKQRTPIAYAVEGGHLAAVIKLFSLGADPNITDERGWTALDYAIDGFKSGKNEMAFEKIISKILEHGGEAKKFPEEARNIIHQIEETKKEALKQKAVDSIFSAYKTKEKIRFLSEQKEYLEEVKTQKKIGPGKK